MEAKYFRDVLDVNLDGFLDLDEISAWVEPEGFVQIKSEVVYLMQKLDKDGDKHLNLREIMKDPEIFLTSQVTHYGHIYTMQKLREKVFLLPPSITDSSVA